MDTELEDREPGEAADGPGETFYDAMKQEAAARVARTQAALAALPKAQRVTLEGHTPGTYLRLLLTGMLVPLLMLLNRLLLASICSDTMWRNSMREAAFCCIDLHCDRSVAARVSAFALQLMLLHSLSHM